jgi:hypothetical protein
MLQSLDYDSGLGLIWLIIHQQSYDLGLKMVDNLFLDGGGLSNELFPNNVNSSALATIFSLHVQCLPMMGIGVLELPNEPLVMHSIQFLCDYQCQ